MRIVREFLDTGRSATVEKAVAASGKRKEIEQRQPLRRNFLSAAMVAKILAEPRAARGDGAPASERRGAGRGSPRLNDDPRCGGVKREDYLGDFQMHSEGSDGADTVAALARACMKRGYRYMCVTDHSYGLPIAGGMSMDALRAQHAEIAAVNAKYGDRFRILKSVEANIRQDGTLDMPINELREFELVVASPHSSLRKSSDQTLRMLAAVSLPGVQILGHPRGRMFNLRAGVIADWPAVFRKAVETGVAIEIDGDVSRQDLDFRVATAAKKAGCLFALDSDAPMRAISFGWWITRSLMPGSRVFRRIGSSIAGRCRSFLNGRQGHGIGKG